MRKAFPDAASRHGGSTGLASAGAVPHISGMTTPAPKTSPDVWTLPPEWTPHARTWIAWPQRPATWHGAIAAARAAHAELAKAIAAFEPVKIVCAPDELVEASLMCGPGIELLPLDLSDGWMRDIGPTFVRGPGGELAGIDWIFNGWGGLHDDFAADAAVAAAVLAARGVQRLSPPLVFEGGALNGDGAGTILLTEECALDPNRNPGMTKAEIEAVLEAYLGARSVIWLGRGYDGDETRGHVDEVAAFVAPAKVLISVTANADDPNHATQTDNLARLEAARDAAGRALEIIQVPQPAPRIVDGRRLTLSYVNFAFANGGLILPQFGDPADDAALRLFSELFPDRRIVPMLADDFVIGGGGIHCVTQQEPAATSPHPGASRRG
jgi:agmatine deiminase